MAAVCKKPGDADWGAILEKTMALCKTVFLIGVASILGSSSGSEDSGVFCHH